MSGDTELRIFTLEEANRAIQDLRETLPAVRKALRNIERAEERLEILNLICNRAVASGNPDLREYLGVRVKYHRAITRLEELLDRLERSGYLLIDLDKGVVHFAARQGGQDVLLCWKEGEKVISHWHEPSEDEHDEDERRQIRNWDDT